MQIIIITLYHVTINQKQLITIYGLRYKLPQIIFAVKLNLEGYNLKNLRYLQHGDTRQDEAEDAIRFQAWKACLGT